MCRRGLIRVFKVRGNEGLCTAYLEDLGPVVSGPRSNAVKPQEDEKVLQRKRRNAKEREREKMLEIFWKAKCLFSDVLGFNRSLFWAARAAFL